jgi:RimJ/RimL family protein N-acetyltransferase
MRIRSLKEKDAPFMLEWMHDLDINKYFRFDGNQTTIDSALIYIRNSLSDDKNRHFAVIEENDDEYLGTISLKNIDFANKNAEYAISLRKKAIGTGISKYATDELMKIAFNEIHLHKVYLNVLSENIRAIRFYEKYGFIFEGEFKDCLSIAGKYKSLKWYRYMENESCKD